MQPSLHDVCWCTVCCDNIFQHFQHFTLTSILWCLQCRQDVLPAPPPRYSWTGIILLIKLIKHIADYWNWRYRFWSQLFHKIFCLFKMFVSQAQIYYCTAISLAVITMACRSVHWVAACACRDKKWRVGSLGTLVRCQIPQAKLSYFRILFTSRNILVQFTMDTYNHRFFEICSNKTIFLKGFRQFSDINEFCRWHTISILQCLVNSVKLNIGCPISSWTILLADSRKFLQQALIIFMSFWKSFMSRNQKVLMS